MTPKQIGKIFDDNADQAATELVENTSRMSREKFIEVVLKITENKRQCNNCDDTVESCLESENKALSQSIEALLVLIDSRLALFDGEKIGKARGESLIWKRVVNEAQKMIFN